ncbi:MAG: hypothetical protein WBF17_05625, partial [Phycisphaerae bacterium]
MPKPTDIRPVAASLYFLPVEMRIPLKFGPETTTRVTCARARLTVESADGRRADGWGETPLSVQWVWPSEASYDERHEALKAFCVRLAGAWAEFEQSGHAMEVGCAFLNERLPNLLTTFNASRAGESMPYLAALVCCSVFDIALHDAFGAMVGRPTYETYNAELMNADLAAWLAGDAGVSFAGRCPADFLLADRPDRLPAWHLVGGKDVVDPSQLTG